MTFRKIGFVVGDNPSGLYFACRVARCYEVRVFVGERFRCLLGNDGKKLSCQSPWRWSKSHRDTIRSTTYGPGTTMSIEKLDMKSKTSFADVGVVIMCADPSETKELLKWVDKAMNFCKVVISLQTGLSQNSSIMEFLKERDTTLQCIMGASGVHATVVETCDSLLVADCLFGAVVIERLPKDKVQSCGFALDILEHSGMPVIYRYSRQIRNWVWGDLLWKSLLPLFHMQLVDDRRSGLVDSHNTSVYEMLMNSQPLRLAILAGLDDGFNALKGQRTDYMDSVTSPFWMGFTMSRWTLRLSNRWFRVFMRLWLRLQLFKDVDMMKSFGVCVDWETCVLEMEYTTGELLRFAKSNGTHSFTHDCIREALEDKSKLGEKWVEIKSHSPSGISSITTWMSLSILVVVLAVAIPWLFQFLLPHVLGIFW